ncbi:MAG: hypothetical protein RL885_08225 [Planctomycetota bacterium]
MFTVECPGCMTTYKVSKEMVGKRLPCKKCGRTIRVMNPRQAAEQKKAANQMPIILAVIGVVAIAIVFFMISQSGDNPEVAAETADSGGDRTSFETKTDSSAVGSENELDPQASVRAFLGAVDDFNQVKAMEFISQHRFSNQFAPAAEILGDRSYADLDGPARTDYEKRLFDALLSDELRGAVILSDLDVGRTVDRPGSEVEITVKTGNAKKQAVMQFVLTRSAGLGWKVAELHRSGSYFDGSTGADLAGGGGDPTNDGDSGDLADAGSGGEESRGAAVPKRNDQIERVPLLEDTSAETNARIKELVATLTDLDVTAGASAARNEILRIGKPAIPHLLNAIADRNLSSHEDILVVNQVVITLRDLTGKSFGFAPRMGLASSTGDSQDKALRGWFGWWRTYGKKFVPPEQPEDIRIPQHKQRNKEKKVGG